METLLQLEISSSGAGLAGPQVSFSVPYLWRGIPIEVTPPAGWSCADTSTTLSAGANCTAAHWAGTVGTFMVSVPTPGILQGYPMKISVSASGAESFNGWIWFK
ncbi:hypothetical protein NHF46_19280 [Arthrobacter alpinus]|nr:hypothetical protein [Arthrobacter alpinus]